MLGSTKLYPLVYGYVLVHRTHQYTRARQSHTEFVPFHLVKSLEAGQRGKGHTQVHWRKREGTRGEDKKKKRGGTSFAALEGFPSAQLRGGGRGGKRVDISPNRWAFHHKGCEAIWFSSAYHRFIKAQFPRPL